jgi:cation diffusion facilitator CzcD-associated flavoprotein CzcO
MSWVFRTSVFSDLEETDPDLPEHCTVMIVGAGAAGVGVGKRLAKAGRGDFLLLEQAVDLDQELRRGAHACGVWSHIRFDAALRRACWDAAHAMWRLRASRGNVTANFLVLATGRTQPSVLPNIHGRDGRSLAQTRAEPGQCSYPGGTVPEFPNLFAALGACDQLDLVAGGLNLFARKGIREFEVRADLASDRRPKRFQAQDYHLTVGHLYHGDPRYREVEMVPVPSAVGSERLAP